MKGKVFYIAMCYLFGVIALFTTYVAVTLSFEKKDLQKIILAQSKSGTKMTKEISVLHDALKAPKPKNIKKSDCDGGMCLLNKPVEKPLAIKNNNPLNVKALKNEKWKGQVGVDEFNHAVFSSPEYGLRAAAHVLMNYYATHKLDTIDGIVERFCTDNKDAYKSFLAKNLRIKEKAKFNVMDKISDLMFYMAKFETGREWPRNMFVPYTVASLAYEKGQQK